MVTSHLGLPSPPSEHPGNPQFDYRVRLLPLFMELEQCWDRPPFCLKQGFPDEGLGLQNLKKDLWRSEYKEHGLQGHPA